MGIAFTLFGGVLGICAFVVLIWFFVTVSNMTFSNSCGDLPLPERLRERAERKYVGWQLRRKFVEDFTWARKKFGLQDSSACDAFLSYSSGKKDAFVDMREFDYYVCHRILGEEYSSYAPKGFKKFLVNRVKNGVGFDTSNVEPTLQEFIDFVRELKASEELYDLFAKYGVEEEVTALGKLKQGERTYVWGSL